MLKITEYDIEKQELMEKSPEQDIAQKIQAPLKFLSTFVITTTVSSGARTIGSEIKVPMDLVGKKFRITDIFACARSSTAAAMSAGDNLLVGLLIDGKPLINGSRQTINGVAMTLDMLPVCIIQYNNATTQAWRRACFPLLSEIFNNVKNFKIAYSHKSTNAVHYLIYLTIGGVIL